MILFPPPPMALLPIGCPLMLLFGPIEDDPSEPNKLPPVLLLLLELLFNDDKPPRPFDTGRLPNELLLLANEEFPPITEPPIELAPIGFELLSEVRFPTPFPFCKVLLLLLNVSNFVEFSRDDAAH